MQVVCEWSWVLAAAVAACSGGVDGAARPRVVAVDVRRVLLVVPPGRLDRRGAQLLLRVLARGP